MKLEITEVMIEAGAKAAYGAIFVNPEDWPNVSCSVSADGFRAAAKACLTAALATKESVPVTHFAKPWTMPS